MARSPRGRCITCDKYTTLMYVDQCRTCFEFEESIEKGTPDQQPRDTLVDEGIVPASFTFPSESRS